MEMASDLIDSALLRLPYGEALRKHRRKLVTGAAMCAGAYALYSWASQDLAGVDEEELRREFEQAAERELREPAGAGTGITAEVRSEHLASSRQTAEYYDRRLLATLREALRRSVPSRQLVGELRKGGELTPAQKEEKWGEMKVLAFAGTAVGLCSVALLDLLVSVKVELVMRNFSQAVSAADGGGGAEGYPTDRCAEVIEDGGRRFLNAGLPLLARDAIAAARDATSEMDLQVDLSPADVLQLVERVVERVLRGADGTLRAARYALPELHGAAGQRHTEPLQVQQMWDETECVVRSDFFEEAVAASVGSCEDVLAQFLQAKMAAATPPDTMKMAKVAPLLTNAFRLTRLFHGADPSEEGPNAYLDAIASADAVQALRLAAYFAHDGRKATAEADDVDVSKLGLVLPVEDKMVQAELAAAKARAEAVQAEQALARLKLEAAER